MKLQRTFRQFKRLSIETLQARTMLCASSLLPECDQAVTVETSTADATHAPLVNASGEPTLSLDGNGDARITAADAAFLCGNLEGTELGIPVLPGDADFSGKVEFEDFLIMSANFGRAGHFGMGDFDCSGTVEFADFLAMAANFGKTTDYQLPVLEDEPEDVCDNAECVYPGQEAYFQQIMATPSSAGKVYYIQPGVEFDRLDIIGRHGDEIHFLPGSRVEGNVKATGDWEPDRGVVNIEASGNLLITGLDATNNYLYQRQNVDGDEQSSTVLTISWSENIELRDTDLTSHGKVAAWIQGNSVVEMTNTEIDCYYFCVGVWASELTSQNMVMNQHNEEVSGDRHAAIWVSSTMRAPDNTFYGNSSVSFTDTTINKHTGEGIIVGNGGYDYRSNVEFKGTTRINRTGPAASRDDGWLAVHPNYFGISLFLAGDYPATTADRASQAGDGEMGRFVVHRYQGTGINEDAPTMIVCDDDGCASSIDVFG